MKKDLMLPSLFVFNSFLVGLLPKTSNAGNVTYAEATNTDSMSVYVSNYNIYPDFGVPIFGSEYVKLHKLDSVVAKPKYSAEYELTDNFSYNILSVGKAVKYVSEDGSGFIRSCGSRTWRNMNPGAIRYGDFTKQYGACGKAGGFAVFPTEEQGMEALKGLLKSDSYSNLTIASAIYKWAPPFENDTKSYQRKLSNMTGLSLSKKINELTPSELERVANAIKILEGWKTGKEEFFDNSVSMTKPSVKNVVNYQNLIQKQYNA